RVVYVMYLLPSIAWSFSFFGLSSPRAAAAGSHEYDWYWSIRFLHDEWVRRWPDEISDDMHLIPSSTALSAPITLIPPSNRYRSLWTCRMKFAALGSTTSRSG